MNTELQDTQSVFDRYESIRHRLPVARSFPRTSQIASLAEISDQIDAFVFDAFGVLNVGETPIPGAAERLNELRAAGRAIRVLTNAASYQRAGAIAKFKRLGLTLEDAEIVTSRDAALRGLETEKTWGVIAARWDDLMDVPGSTVRLDMDPDDYDRVDGFIFLSAADWGLEQQSLLEETIGREPRPVVIANADLVAPRDDGFSLEPGYFGHRIADHTDAQIICYGKPFPDVFQMVEASLPGVKRNRIAMCGDSLHTDILGAAAAGWRSVLVTQDGLFAGTDVTAYSTTSGISADWQLSRI